MGMQTRRVDGFYQNLPTSEVQRVASHPHAYLGRGICEIGDRPSQVARVRSVIRELQRKYTSMNSQSGSQTAEFNLFLDQLPRQISFSNFYQARIIR